MKTVNVKGKAYQIGALYQDDGGEIGILKSVDESKDCPFVLAFYSSSFDRSKPVSRLNCVSRAMGTIIDAPIELEDGNWYEVELNSTCETALYRKDGKFYDNKTGGVPLKPIKVRGKLVNS